MSILATPDAARNSCDSRNENLARSYGSVISWRKILILNRGALSRAWGVAFPRHDFSAGRLKRYPLDTFERACDRAKTAAAKHPRNPRIEHLRKLLEDDVPIDRVWNDISGARRRPTPQTTIEAIMLSVQQHGLEALEYPVNVERLLRCNKGAKTEINRRIAKLRNASNERA
jgi:hypothetical protein